MPATAVKEKPIIFDGESVRAILAEAKRESRGEKTMRRFLVRCGDLCEEVEIDVPGVRGNETEIGAAAINQCVEWAERDPDEKPPPDMGHYMSIVEIVGDEMWMLSEEALRKAGRLAEEKTKDIKGESEGGGG